MQSMQRKFGKLLPRSADESQVSVLLNEFESADRMLQKLIDGTKAWRDSWRDILTSQHRLTCEFRSMYEPIVGAGKDHTTSHEAVLTPEPILQRAIHLQDAYNELKVQLLEEINLIDQRIIRPAKDAREYIKPMKKTIKLRQDRKLDFERYQGRYDAVFKKKQRSERENAALAKHESDLARSKEDYYTADDALKQNLPPLVSAVFSVLPHLLAAQVLVQNHLLSNYYTVLHDFCLEEHLPSPPPPATEILAVWEADFKPVQVDIETNISFVRSGKAVKQPMEQKERAHSSTTGLNIRNGLAERRTSHQTAPAYRPSISPAPSVASQPPSPNYDTKPLAIESAGQSSDDDGRPRILSVPSQTSLALAVPNYATPTSPGYLSPASAHAPAGPRADYFSRDRVPSNGSSTSITLAAKKKPPPPPPPKKKPSFQALFVTALYDFVGEGEGDLNFRAGDRIKVTKKTESLQDWWEGELDGVQGSFPANYCQPA